jgi:hypothetical protein
MVPGCKFCDLGMGTGFVQAVFAALGFRSYGIDVSDKALEYAPEYFDRIQREFGRNFNYAPIIARCDANVEGLSSFEFPDGIKMHDMDVFFCNIGDESDYHIKIMRNLRGIKKGCVWMDYYLMYVRMDNSGGWDEEIPSILETPFRPINPQFLYSFLISV